MMYCIAFVSRIFVRIFVAIIFVQLKCIKFINTWNTFKSKLAIVKIKLKAEAATDMVLGGMHSPENWAIFSEYVQKLDRSSRMLTS